MKKTRVFPKITIPKTKAEWSNFWYYKKFQVIASIITIFFVSYLFIDILNVQEPDILMIYGGSAPMTTEMSEHIKEELTLVLKDINSDNQINFTFVPMVIGEKVTTDQDGIMMSKLTTEITAGDIAIYIFDRGMIELFAGQGILTPLDDIAEKLNITNVYKTTPKERDEEKIYGISLADNKFITSLGIDPSDMYISVRNLTQRQQGKEKPLKQNKYYLEVLEYIITY